MSSSVDSLAADLVTGKESCGSCPGLNNLIEAVRNEEISMEDFKSILNDAKRKQASQVI